MTVGSLFLLIISWIVILLGISYIFYRLEIKRLKKIGCHSPSDAISYSYYMLISFLVTVAIVSFGVLLYTVITNWNMPI